MAGGLKLNDSATRSLFDTAAGGAVWYMKDGHKTGKVYFLGKKRPRHAPQTENSF